MHSLLRGVTLNDSKLWPTYWASVDTRLEEKHMHLLLIFLAQFTGHYVTAHPAVGLQPSRYNWCSFHPVPAPELSSMRGAPKKLILKGFPPATLEKFVLWNTNCHLGTEPRSLQQQVRLSASSLKDYLFFCWNLDKKINITLISDNLR